METDHEQETFEIRSDRPDHTRRADRICRQRDGGAGIPAL
jgi:hypothetical protein